MAKQKTSRPLSRKSIERLEAKIGTASIQVANQVLPKHKVTERPLVRTRVSSELGTAIMSFSEIDYPRYSHGEQHDYAIAIQKGLLMGYILGRQLFPEYRRTETLDEKVTRELARIQASPYGIDYTLRRNGPLLLENFMPLISKKLTTLEEDPRAMGASDRAELYAGAFGYMAAIGIEELFIEEMRTTTGNLRRRDVKRMEAQAAAFLDTDMTENDIEPSA